MRIGEMLKEVVKDWDKQIWMDHFIDGERVKVETTVPLCDNQVHVNGIDLKINKLFEISNGQGIGIF
mgnify:CR=1 FL=1